MENSFITRFANEVAPPQYISVMRHRVPKMLDTITEEDRVNAVDTYNTSHFASSSSDDPLGGVLLLLLLRRRRLFLRPQLLLIIVLFLMIICAFSKRYYNQ